MFSSRVPCVLKVAFENLSRAIPARLHFNRMRALGASSLLFSVLALAAPCVTAIERETRTYKGVELPLLPFINTGGPMSERLLAIQAELQSKGFDTEISLLPTLFAINVSGEFDKDSFPLTIFFADLFRYDFTVNFYLFPIFRQTDGTQFDESPIEDVSVSDLGDLILVQEPDVQTGGFFLAPGSAVVVDKHKFTVNCGGAVVDICGEIIAHPGVVSELSDSDVVQSLAIFNGSVLLAGGIFMTDGSDALVTSRVQLTDANEVVLGVATVVPLPPGVLLLPAALSVIGLRRRRAAG